MTRPHIIRADTIDLQDRSAPSAKDHRRPPPQSTTFNGLLAPHQAETIREVVEDRADEECRSPQLSWANGDSGDLSQHPEALAYHVANSINRNNMQQQDALVAAAQNGGAVSDDADMGAEGDEDLDDDMMDKISSSPSIEDGGYTLPSPWPRRVDSLHHSVSYSDAPSSPGLSEARSSSPYLDAPEHPPLQSLSRQASKAAVDASSCHHHLPGEYTGRGEDHDARDDRDYGTDHTEVNENDESARCDSTDYEDPYEEMEQGNLSSSFEKSIEFVERRIQSVGAPRQAMEQARQRHPDSPTIDPELDRDDGYDFTIPYDASEDDDDDDFPFTDDPRYIDSGWDGECLQDSEDIDFEFVYALHTFVATVEGQANATKGDTMVLLDDSNSYWWLVRVVKDSSIGYLPAEHIETPTERLARLNKHRNIDLAATMLGDQAEKTKNPLKSAMRRRKKTVTFTAPTYVDYPDLDYSTDEEEGEGEEVPTQQQQGQKAQQQATAQKATIEAADDDEGAKVEPLKPRGQKQAKLATAKAGEKNDVDDASEDEARRASDEIFDGKSERTTRNGTVRNTDSFFKDDTIETKKITLTPGLLRDDNEGRGSSDSKEVRQRPSLDRLEKELVPDKAKDDKKKKEKKEKEKDKKSGSIRSFFSRKDKKKSGDDDDDSLGKRSMDDADDSRQAEQEASPEKQATLQRHPSKLQKQQPRPETSPTRNPALVTTQPNTVENVPPTTSSLRMVEPEPLEALEKAQKEEKLRSVVSKVGQPSTETKPSNVTNKARSQVEPDGLDSSRNELASEPARAPPEPERPVHEEKRLRPTLPGAFPDSYLSTQTSTSLQQRAEPDTANTKPAAQQRSESPAPVSPLSPSAASKPPALVADTSSQEDKSSPISSPSPEPADTRDRTHQKQDSTTTSTSTATTSTWNDTNLRAFFDSGSEIRDLLTVVYDKTDVPPAGPEHPVVGLFREPNAKLAEITTQLDNMLGDWLARKQRLRGTV
ncbi:hypothetical protein DL771_000083 [Monosporascus sp. 5C6A]|nr:hypothetical protein DL771_000083 [Monosporascus sp. 5C6A]